MDDAPQLMGEINRATWRKKANVRRFARLEGWAFGRMLRAAKDAPRAARNYRRYSALNEEYDGYSIMNAAAHNHGLLPHYITMERQCEELENAGYLAGPEIYDNVHGRRIGSGDDTSNAWWLHYVARKA